MPAAGATSFTRQQAPLGLGHAVWCAREIIGDNRICKVSVVGIGMRSHTGIASKMFKALADEGIHGGWPEERELLWSAAMLHDIGTAVDYDDHHKHSRYLVLNAGLPGYAQREVALIGGEMAEHPGAMEAGEFDLVGFSVGIAERDVGVVGADHVDEQRERAVVELHLHAVERAEGRRDLEQVQVDRLVGTEHLARGHSEGKRVADLARGAGDGDVDGGLHEASLW